MEKSTKIIVGVSAAIVVTTTIYLIFRKNINATETENPKKRWRMRRVSGSLLVSPSTRLEFDSITVKGENEEWEKENGEL